MRSKVLIISIFFMLILSQSSFALGQRYTGTITAVVYVKGLFQLSMNSDVIDFAKAAPGKTADSDHEVAVISRSTGTDNWYIQVSSDRPLTSGANVIPNKYFTWGGDTKGRGVWHGGKYAPLNSESKVAYRSSEDEINNLPDGTQNDFSFRLFIPEDQPGGEYTCTVMFTMTE
ncbi:hypothetical protein ACFLZ2_04190 [Candidatus Margulisiibacteriota bacterium]